MVGQGGRDRMLTGKKNVWYCQIGYWGNPFGFYTINGEKKKRGNIGSLIENLLPKWVKAMHKKGRRKNTPVFLYLV